MQIAKVKLGMDFFAWEDPAVGRTRRLLPLKWGAKLSSPHYEEDFVGRCAVLRMLCGFGIQMMPVILLVVVVVVLPALPVRACVWLGSWLKLSMWLNTPTTNRTPKPVGGQLKFLYWLTPNDRFMVSKMPEGRIRDMREERQRGREGKFGFWVPCSKLPPEMDWKAQNQIMLQRSPMQSIAVRGQRNEQRKSKKEEGRAFLQRSSCCFDSHDHEDEDDGNWGAGGAMLVFLGVVSLALQE